MDDLGGDALLNVTLHNGSLRMLGHCHRRDAGLASRPIPLATARDHTSEFFDHD
jgi:hypothetical protein